MADADSSLSSRFAKLAAFGKLHHHDDDEDQGEEIDFSTVAGGGHGVRRSETTKNRLRVSHALRSFLHREGLLPEHSAQTETKEDDEILRALLDKPHVVVPPELTDRSHPLPEYFISSSHNTYLMAHQLYGTSSAAAYDTALNAGARCVEIDAWDNEVDKDEPKVTHGYTLVSHVPFRAVCETIRDVIDKEAAQSVNVQGYRAAPIFLSLENHCAAYGQLRLVQIMTEVWGDRLLSRAVREKGHEEQEGEGEDVRLDELGSKIAVIVEYYLPKDGNEPEIDTNEIDGEDEEERKAQYAYEERKKAAAKASVIIPELAAMGVYAQSVKPVDNSWFATPPLKNGPHHHLINVSESGLAAHLPGDADKIALHNALHLMRVFPMGTRIMSTNLKPVPFWGVGAQICAMNWQTFGASTQLNEALFAGTDGYVLKPAALRAGGTGILNTGRTAHLRLHIAGASDVPVPPGRESKDDIKPYVTCSLIHPNDLHANPEKRKTDHYRQHKLVFLHKGENPPVTDPVWNETLEWDFEDNELAFLRILIKSDDRFATNPKLAVAAVRLSYVMSGWTFIRMLDLKGRETTCTLLVKFEMGHRD